MTFRELYACWMTMLTKKENEWVMKYEMNEGLLAFLITDILTSSLNIKCNHPCYYMDIMEW